MNAHIEKAHPVLVFVNQRDIHRGYQTKASESLSHIRYDQRCGPSRAFSPTALVLSDKGGPFSAEKTYGRRAVSGTCRGHERLIPLAHLRVGLSVPAISPHWVRESLFLARITLVEAATGRKAGVRLSPSKLRRLDDEDVESKCVCAPHRLSGGLGGM